MKPYPPVVKLVDWRKQYAVFFYTCCALTDLATSGRAGKNGRFLEGRPWRVVPGRFWKLEGAVFNGLTGDTSAVARDAMVWRSTGSSAPRERRAAHPGSGVGRVVESQLPAGCGVGRLQTGWGR